MRRIIIVGGGLAGLTLGILLRRRGVPVQLWDLGGYPRHRVCGEFVSGAGGELLRELLPDLAASAGSVRTIRFFADGRSTRSLPLPQPGLAITRYELDGALSRKFEECGGELIVKKRWTERFDGEGVVRATGRRLEGMGGWTGLKAHAVKFVTRADLEMHFGDFGYLGISQLPQGVNLSALVNGDSRFNGFRENPLGTFQRLVGAECAQMFTEAELVPGSVCAVSGISFAAERRDEECRLGDAMRMIPPFTGNGMSLAVESAGAAAPVLARYSECLADWPTTLRGVRRNTHRMFQRRFAAATLLQFFASRTWTRLLLLSSFRTAPKLLPVLFGLTR